MGKVGDWKKGVARQEVWGHWERGVSPGKGGQ